MVIFGHYIGQIDTCKIGQGFSFVLCVRVRKLVKLTEAFCYEFITWKVFSTFTATV